MSLGTPSSESFEEIRDQLDAGDFLTPWARVSATAISYGGMTIDTAPSGQEGVDFINDSGLNINNTQIGTNGSSFWDARKALGTIAVPQALGSGGVIGWYAFSGYDGTSYVSSSGIRGQHIVVNGETVGRLNLSTKRENDTIPTTGATLDEDHSFILTDYGSRDDGTPSQGRVIWVDSSGKLHSGPPRIFYSDGPTDQVDDEGTGVVYNAVSNVTVPSPRPAGRYEVIVSCEATINSTIQDYLGRILLNNVRQGQIVRREGKDAAGGGVLDPTTGVNSGTDQAVSIYLRRIVTLTETQAAIFMYQHAASNGSQVGSFDTILSVEYIGP